MSPNCMFTPPEAQVTPSWMFGALWGAPILLALLPLLDVWPGWLLAVFLQLPLYMIHQVEEHTSDAFRRFINLHLIGREVLTRLAVAVINIGGVWIIDLTALLAAGLLHPGYGLVAVYLTLINALVHIAATVRLRAYNPGLWTALGLFIPGGILALWLVSAQPGVDWRFHLFGIVAVILLHLAIILHVRRRVVATRPA